MNQSQPEWEDTDSEILHILIAQQQITNAGINYNGEKDWALNKIRALLLKTRTAEQERVVERLSYQYVKIDENMNMAEKYEAEVTNRILTDITEAIRNKELTD